MNIILSAIKMPVSYTTIAVAAILLIMFIVGCKNGLLKSILKMITAIGAIAAAIFASPYLYNVLIKQEFLAALGEMKGIVTNLLSFVIVWLAAFIVLKIICSIINKVFSGNDGILSSINRILGGIFAVAEGFLFVIVITYIINLFPNVPFIKTIIDNGQIDAFSKWLYDNNLVDKIFAFLSDKIPAFKQFVESISNMVPKAN